MTSYDKHLKLLLLLFFLFFFWGGAVNSTHFDLLMNIHFANVAYFSL